MRAIHIRIQQRQLSPLKLDPWRFVLISETRFDRVGATLVTVDSLAGLVNWWVRMMDITRFLVVAV